MRMLFVLLSTLLLGVSDLKAITARIDVFDESTWVVTEATYTYAKRTKSINLNSSGMRKGYATVQVTPNSSLLVHWTTKTHDGVVEHWHHNFDIGNEDKVIVINGKWYSVPTDSNQAMVPNETPEQD